MRFHLNLVINNNTTLEYVQAKRNNRDMTERFNIGTSGNWKQIFGNNKLLWFLPISNTNEEFQGINYPRPDFNDE